MIKGKNILRARVITDKNFCNFNKSFTSKLLGFWLSMKFSFTKLSSDISDIQRCNNLLAHSSNSRSFSSCDLSFFLSLLSISSISFSRLLISSSSLVSYSSLASFSLASISSSLILLSALTCLSCATSLVSVFTHLTNSFICSSIFSRFWLQNWKNNLMANYHNCLSFVLQGNVTLHITDHSLSKTTELKLSSGTLTQDIRFHLSYLVVKLLDHL